LMPTTVLVPTGEDLVCRANLFIPIDDENCWWYRVRYHVRRPLSDDELAEYKHGTLDYAKLIPGTYIPEGGRANDYLMDRGLQKSGSFTGIPSAQLQDIAVQESQGAIPDRTKEHLGTSDTAIVKCRRRLIESARKFVSDGTLPVAAARGDLYKRRAVAMLLPKEVTAEQAGSHPATVSTA
jgi:phthalate 4,5-dioxygenase